MLQLRGGNAGIVRNGFVYSDGEQGCLRKALLRYHGVQTEIDANTQKVFNIGFYNEDWHAAQKVEQGVQFEADKEVVFQINDNVQFCGHIDFFTQDTTPEEHKSITSMNTHNLVFRDNQYKKDNLAQLASYMVALETPVGELTYTSFIEAIQYKDIPKFTWGEIEEKLKSITPQTKTFAVTILDNEQFAIDSVPIDLYISNVVDFWREGANVLEQNLVYPHRPVSDKKFGSPCDFCPFSSVCNQWEDNPTTTEDFINLVKRKIL
jgi:hypothetical protein